MRNFIMFCVCIVSLFAGGDARHFRRNRLAAIKSPKTLDAGINAIKSPKTLDAGINAIKSPKTLDAGIKPTVRVAEINPTVRVAERVDNVRIQQNLISQKQNAATVKVATRFSKEISKK
jgi:hypothetical protein